ncbi:MAG: PVC-type heme-binding CxxCH protein [Isosphaeraceae bacterium]
MRRFLALVVFLSPSLAIGSDPGSPTPIKVLFLGDKGHHRPADRARQIIPVLGDRGISITYTENPNDLNPKTLGQYDALLLYANIDRIEPDQEKALLDYVAGGGGFVPLHCASYCFRNAPAVVALIGAQFQRHGTGEFDTQTVDADHPITRGLTPFRTWDETYVHTLHDEKDRHVLQTRAEGDQAEPWTWVKTHGKGRVFYTAYGHDGRTWGVPGFHDLVERGIRWASNRGEVVDTRSRPNAGLPPFTYRDAGSKIPNYLAGQRWGTQGDAYTSMQDPLSPEESARHLVMPRGFKAQLFAAEPQINRPLWMAWDHKGRLWIGESTDYPNDLKRDGQGNDRIKICEDTDGDGKADKFTIFAEGLSIPTSLTFANGGVIVSQAPDMLFLQDLDGDDRADVRKVLFTGWGTRDTHAGPSNLRRGFDHWIHGMVGYSGFDGTVGGERLRFGQGFFRFLPDGSKLEFLRSTNNNSWGLGFTEEGILFGSTANGCPSVHLAVPNRYYESVKGWSPTVLASIASWNRFFPITEKVRQVDWHGGFTAAAGHAVYTARAYPRHYWNRAAFVTEPTGHLVATFLLQPNGTDFGAENTWNLLASDDEWTSPIAAEVGPDGQVWVIDWYNYIVQHNPTPQGFQTGKGNAYETPLRDKTHGRVYRVVYQEGTPSNGPKALDPTDGPGLVAGLKSDNQFWRLHAQRLLVERGETDVAPSLVALVRDTSVDEIGLNPAAIHALWTLQGLNALNDGEGRDAAIAALRHPSAGVRRNAARVLPEGPSRVGEILSAGLLNDPDPQVKLAALLAIATSPPSNDAGRALASMVLQGLGDGDRWLADAATSAAAAHASAFLETVGATDPSQQASARGVAVQIVGRVAEHLARGGPGDSIGRLVATYASANPRVADPMILGLARGWPRETAARLTEADEKALATLLPRLSTEARGALVRLAGRWGSKGLERHAREVAASLLAEVKNASKSDEARGSAARQLIEFRPNDVEAARELLALVTPRTSPALASGLIAALARTEGNAVARDLLDALPSLTPAARAEALRALISRDDWAGSFLGGVEQGQVRLDELSLDQRQALVAHPNAAIANRAKAILSRGGGLPDPDRQKVIEELTAAAMRPGLVARGKEVFTQQCAKCHRYNGEGGKVGPDLSGMAAHPREELLVHILDPSRSVEGNYVSYTVAMTDGRTLTGLLASETRTAIELLDAEGKSIPILREEVDELIASKKSLMPEGFEKQVPPEALADLLAFLTQRGKYMPLDLRKVATISSAQGMFFDKESSIERMIFPDWTPKVFEGVPFALVDPEDGRTPNVVLLHGPNGPTAPKMPRSVELPCNAPARAIHLLSGVSGWGYNGGANHRPTVSMIVRLTYADGQTEDHPLRDGVEFADYIRRVDVPGSTFAFSLRGQQIRHLSVTPKRTEPIERISLVKGGDRTAPIVMAVTVELPE